MIAGLLLLADGAAHTAADRESLLDELIRLCRQRDAPAPAMVAQGHDFAAEAQTLRPVFRAATTDEALYFALVRLSNLRRDTHLRVYPVEGGIACPQPPALHLPIRFAADMETGELFVADVSRDFLGGSPAPRHGDVLLRIDGRTIDEYTAHARPWIRAGSEPRFRMELAESIGALDDDNPMDRGARAITVRLQRDDGEPFTLTLPYVPEAGIEWAGWCAFEGYPGFRPAMTSRHFSVHRPISRKLPVIVLRWLDFADTVSDTDAIMKFAVAQDLLDHDVIIDATECSGGSHGWYLLQRLTDRPFRVTHGNLRISDVTPDLVELLQAMDDACNDWCRQWIENDVMTAIDAGRAWTGAVPFKLRALPAGGDGLLHPAKTRFRGRVVFLFGPEMISAGDQFAAMVVDNRIAHSIGMPTAGHSNTWEWQDTVRFPERRTPVVRFEWSLGQTLRPNGQVLEGNPVVPDELIPVTRANHRRWRNDLVHRARYHLMMLRAADEKRSGAGSG